MPLQHTRKRRTVRFALHCFLWEPHVIATTSMETTATSIHVKTMLCDAASKATDATSIREADTSQTEMHRAATYIALDEPA